MGLLGAFILRPTLLLWFTVNFAFALPTHHSRGSAVIHSIIHAMTRDVVVDEASGSVVDIEDQSKVDQGSASDGAGSDFNIPAVLWLSFGLAVGIFFTFGGMRLWRTTTAFSIGLVSALCAWATIVNVISAAGLSDLILTLVTLSFFAVGSLGGLFKVCRLAGLTALSILGGMSVGMRIVLMREGLLLRPTSLNWIIIVACAVAEFAVTLFRQRIGIALSCTFTGTFLLSLGVDLATNQQHGVPFIYPLIKTFLMEYGQALRNMPYKPHISTQAILGGSLGLALTMAYVQFRFFSDYIEELNHAKHFSQYLSSPPPTQSTEKFDMDTLRLPLQKPPSKCETKSRFSL